MPTMNELERTYEAARMPMEFRHYAAAAMTLATLTFATAYIATKSAATSIAAAAAILLLAIAIPARQRYSQLERLEENIPDALRHMSIVLKTGGTVENAMEEASRAAYGPLSQKLASALARMRRGQTFEEALATVAAESGSKTFERTANIINDARRAGAGLSEAMAAIAEDAAETHRIRRERVSRTTTHVVFLYASAVGLAPFIFGFTLAIVAVIGSGMSCAAPGGTPFSTSAISDTLVALVAIQALLAVLAASAIRYGSMKRQAVYAPVMVLAALAIYEVGKMAGMAIIGGGGTCA